MKEPLFQLTETKPNSGFFEGRFGNWGVRVFESFNCLNNASEWDLDMILELDGFPDLYVARSGYKTKDSATQGLDDFLRAGGHSSAEAIARTSHAEWGL